MRPHLRSIVTFTLRLTFLGVLLAGLGPPRASAVPPIGFREDWPGTSLQNWSGGSQYENPGTGGVGGAGDGYLLMRTTTPSHLGTVNMSAPYPGNWVAAGIQVIKVSLNDVGNANPLAIHFIIANPLSIWQYNPAFIPLSNQWTEFTVDLTTPGSWTRLLGGATFAQTLSNVDRVHFRHDLAPYTQTPDFIQADVGIDRLIITSFATPARSTTWGRIKRLYR